MTNSFAIEDLVRLYKKGCPKCESSFKVINVEGAYCVKCGFVLYGKLKGENTIEIEEERIKIFRKYLQNNQDSVLIIQKIGEELDLSPTIVRELAHNLGQQNEFFLQIINQEES